MTCPKCGHELKEGNMYCEICGEEIQIVPDFEPEIENSISDVLNDVADQIDPERANKEVEHIHFLTDTIDISKDVVVVPKSLIVKFFVAVISILLIAGIVLGVVLYRDNSYDYQIRKGDEALAKGDYSSAVEFYQDAYRLDRTNMDSLKRIASVYENYENPDKAEEMYYKIIEYNGDIVAVEALINHFINDGKFGEVYNLLITYGNDDLLSKYSQYMCPPPGFSIESGDYNDIKKLELVSDNNGSVFYTVDGSEPGSDSNKYEEPIVLRNGKYTIKAVFVNEFGICSEIAEANYVINSNVPEAPVVSLANGSYDVPQLIRVTVPFNSNVYYTTDGSEPTNNSAIYTDPIAIPEGDSVFKFIAINGEGVESEVVEATYSLNVSTNITKEQAIDIVKNRQVEVGRTLSPEGEVEGSEGKYMYAYSELRYVQNRTLYFVSEYYQEGTIRMVTGNIFAVDVFDGQVYQVLAGSNNTYTLINF